MFKVIIIGLVICSSFKALASPTWATGMGLESRYQREVNPDYGNLQSAGQLYAEMRLHPWVALLEVGLERHESGTGSYVVKAQTVDCGFWGRYEFLERYATPFVSLGVGSYFDRVDTRFQASSDTRTGQRPWVGTGGGVSAVYWNRLLIDLEVRVSAVAEQKDPMISGLFKVGVQI